MKSRGNGEISARNQEITDMMSTEPPNPRSGKSFRWRLIPATFLWPIGVLSVLGSIFVSLSSVVFQLRNGWVTPHPDTPTLNQIALTSKNITIWQLYLWFGVTAIYAAISWQKGRWRHAWITTVFAWILMGIISFLLPAQLGFQRV